MSIDLPKIACTVSAGREVGLDTPERAFGQVLRALRQERGWSQEKLAELSGCTRPYVSYLETGKYSPTLSMLFQLARALGVEPAEIVTQVQVQLRSL